MRIKYNIDSWCIRKKSSGVKLTEAQSSQPIDFIRFIARLSLIKYAMCGLYETIIKMAFKKSFTFRRAQRKGHIAWLGVFVSLVSMHKTTLIMRIQET